MQRTDGTLCWTCHIPLADSPTEFSGEGHLIIRCIGCGAEWELEEEEDDEPDEAP